MGALAFSFLETVGLVALGLVAVLTLALVLKPSRRWFGSWGMMLREEVKTTMGDRDGARAKVIPGGQEKILLVDDEPLVLKVQSELLSSLGYKTECANSGEAAVEYLKQQDADLLLLDLLMDPGIDGVETYRRIKAFKPEQKAVVLTGYATPSQVEEVRSLGAGAYLIKPVPLGMLAKAIRDELDSVPPA